jgi:hypothetical protein
MDAETRAELAALRSEVAQLRARQERRALPARWKRRGAALLAVGLLALTPLIGMAANPVFSDLGDAAAVHQPNIQAIGDAGITTGFDDPSHPGQRTYNPKGLVTREEMASFLARTAGLGGNPPVARALSATTATNAEALSGFPADGLIRIGGTSGGGYLASNTDPVTIATMVIQVPAPGYVKLDQQVVVHTIANGYAGQDCPCQFTIRFQDITTAPGQGYTLSSGSAGQIDRPDGSLVTVGETVVFTARRAGTYQYAAQIFRSSTGPAFPTTAGMYADARVTGVYTPFNNLGNRP